MLRKTPLKPQKGLSRTTLVRKPTKIAKKPLKAKKKAWKFVKTALAECDSAFSKEILKRDGRCQFPHCGSFENLTCSHYIRRDNWNTRFDPLNCIALCTRHHFFDRDTAWEFQKARAEKHGWDGQYTLFMKRWLGEMGFCYLLERAEGKKSRKDAIIETQKKYNLRQPETAENGQTSLGSEV